GTLRELTRKHPSIINQLLKIACKKVKDESDLLRKECAILGISQSNLCETTLTELQTQTLFNLLNGEQITDLSRFYIVQATYDKGVTFNPSMMIRDCGIFGLGKDRIDKSLVNRWDSTYVYNYCHKAFLQFFEQENQGFLEIKTAILSDDLIPKAGAIYLLDGYSSTAEIYPKQISAFLDRIAPGIVDELITLLDHDQLEIKKLALKGLMALGRRAKNATEKIFALLSDKNEDVKLLSLSALGIIGGPQDGVIEKYTSLIELLLEIQKPSQVISEDTEDQFSYNPQDEESLRITFSEIRPETVYLLQGIASVIDNSSARSLLKPALLHEERIVRDTTCEALAYTPSLEDLFSFLSEALDPALVKIPEMDEFFDVSVYSNPFDAVVRIVRFADQETKQQAVRWANGYLKNLFNHIEFAEGRKKDILIEIKKEVVNKLRWLLV
ncbi:MAG: HEAT repeat domain-containing protein, partial [Bdellovibrionales bacterium]|nr:HEAT repeat domain-containing protein [Bdellovibrionales bacterium]